MSETGGGAARFRTDEIQRGGRQQPRCGSSKGQTRRSRRRLGSASGKEITAIAIEDRETEFGQATARATAPVTNWRGRKHSSDGTPPGSLRSSRAARLAVQQRRQKQTEASKTSATDGFKLVQEATESSGHDDEIGGKLRRQHRQGERSPAEERQGNNRGGDCRATLAR